MRHDFSILVCFLSCVAAAAYALVALLMLPYGIMKESEGWTSMIFRFGVAPVIGGGALLLGVIPSAILYTRGRQRIDLISLCVSGATFGLVLATWLFIEPLRQSIIFGK